MADTLERLQLALEGRYALERQIGQGGMATVYLATDLKHDRKVAIKVLLPDLAASVGADRFLREIHVASTLQHPNILGLFDSGQTEGFLYYVMPFVEGESLRDRLDREKQLSVPDAIRITREVAEALAHAHSHGVIHRDIKPENILMSGDHALVADFGIARAVTASGGEKLTRTGMSLGTPHYMSPEQAMGGDEIDGRSDLYSLGCVLYEMLAGQPPFDGPNPQSIMARHSLEPVPSIQVVRRTVPDEVDAAIEVAMAKVPADRFQTVQQFAEVLAQAESGVSGGWTASRAIPSAMRRTGTGPGFRRRRGWSMPVIAGAAAVVVLAVGFAAWRFLARDADSGLATAGATGGLDPRRIAVLYFDDQSRNQELGYLADGLTEGLIRELSTVQTLQVVSRNGVAPYRGVRVAPDSVGRAVRAGTIVSGSVEGWGRDSVRVAVRLFDGGSGADLSTRGAFILPAADVVTIRDSLVREVSGFLRRRVGEEVRVRELREGTRNPDAWALLQRAERRMKDAEALVARGDAAGVARAFEEADSLLALAESKDSRWSEPIVARAMVAYRRSRLAVDDPLAAGRSIAEGLAHLERAVRVNPQNPDALELRGNLQYWKWLLGLEPEPVAARRLLEAAQRDLEQATNLAPSQAGAWSTLSHLYNQTKTSTDISIAAQRALEADAYLSNADVIMTRLFFSNFDAGLFPAAVRWCDEGGQRFPGNYRFLECQLLLMATKAREPDPARAWVLADSILAVTAERDRPYQELNVRLQVAAVLANASSRVPTRETVFLADSARRVVKRSLGDAVVDPTRDLTLTGALVHTMLGDKAEAIDLLKTYLAANPSRRAAFADDPGWMFRDLSQDPGFRQLVGAP